MYKYKIHFKVYSDRYMLFIWPCDGGHAYDNPISTADVNKVTCKRCLRTKAYKDAVDKQRHPLFYWKETCEPLSFKGKGWYVIMDDTISH